MRDTAVHVLVPQGVVVLETVGHVVGVQERRLSRVRETLASEHLDVCPGDKQNRCATILSSGNGIDSFIAVHGYDRVSRKEGREVLSDANGSREVSGSYIDIRDRMNVPNTGSSSSMWNGEGLVQVHVADITTAGRRVGEANLSVQVGTIQVHLTPVFVDDLASLERRLEDAITVLFW